MAAAQSIRMFIDAGLGEEAIAEITRVLGEAMSRVAATTTGAFADTFLQAGDSEQDVAWRFARLAEELIPALSPVLVAAYQAHLRENVQRGMISRAELAAGHLAGEQEMTVCFADPAGFTTLGGQLEAEELGGVIMTFGELAADMAKGGVRLVKTIGDAAMLACREPAPRVGRALSLLDAVEEADLPSLRAGVALGHALPRAGDPLRRGRQPRKPGNRDSSSGQRAVHKGGARRRAGRVRLVIRGQAPSERRGRLRAALPGASPPGGSAGGR